MKLLMDFTPFLCSAIECNRADLIPALIPKRSERRLRDKDVGAILISSEAIV